MTAGVVRFCASDAAGAGCESSGAAAAVAETPRRCIVSCVGAARQRREAGGAS